MQFDPDVHHRRSIRLRSFDYTSHRAYFVTICTRDRGNTLGCGKRGETWRKRATGPYKEVAETWKRGKRGTGGDRGDSGAVEKHYAFEFDLLPVKPRERRAMVASSLRSRCYSAKRCEARERLLRRSRPGRRICLACFGRLSSDYSPRRGRLLVSLGWSHSCYVATCVAK